MHGHDEQRVVPRSILEGYEEGRRRYGAFALSLADFAERAEAAARQRARRTRAADCREILGRLCLADLYVARACEIGADGAVEALDRHHRERMAAAVRIRGAPPSEAEELVADLFAELFGPLAGGASRTRLSTYEGAAPLASWLRAILFRLRADRWRSARGRACEVALAAAEAQPQLACDPAHELEQAELAEELARRLVAAARALTPRERVALRLWTQGALSQRGVARSLCIGEPRASRLLARAAERLRDAIGRSWCVEFERAVGGPVVRWCRGRPEVARALARFLEETGREPPDIRGTGPSTARPAARAPPFLRRARRDAAMGRVRARFGPRLHPLGSAATPSDVTTGTLYEADLDLVREVLAGDAAAREQFCRRMRCIGRILALRNLRAGRPLGEHDLADLAQEVALAVWRRLASYAGEAALESWVYGFCALTWLNAHRRRRSAPAPWNEAGDETPADAAAPPAPDQGIDGYLKHLSAREAEVLRARHVDGLDNREIARALSISVNSVKTHSAHGMRKLREILRARKAEASDVR